jgi:DNA-binding protein HU-beta
MPVKTSGAVTLKHIAVRVAEDNELSKKAAEDILTELVGNIVGHLKRGQRIRLGSLGTLQVRSRAARIGRNPGTGAVIQIEAGKKVTFRASSELLAAIGPLPGGPRTRPPLPGQPGTPSPLPGQPGTPSPLPGTPRTRSPLPVPGADIGSLTGDQDTKPPLPGVESSSTKKSGA